MTYHKDTHPVLIRRGYDPFKDFSASQNSDGTVSLEWTHTDPQPTEQSIADEAGTQAFLDWFAENIGGDPVRSNPALIKRRQAKEYIDEQNHQAQVTRAFRLLVMDELNILRAEHGLAPRTAVQLRNAIKNKITAGDADT